MGKVFNVLLAGYVLYAIAGLVWSVLSLIGFVIFLVVAEASARPIREREEWVRRVGAISWYSDAEGDYVTNEERLLSDDRLEATPALIWGQVLATRKGLTDEDVKWIKWHAANGRMPTSLVG